MMTAFLVIAIEEKIRENNKNLITIQGKYLGFDETSMERLIATGMLEEISELETLKSEE